MDITKPQTRMSALVLTLSENPGYLPLSSIISINDCDIGSSTIMNNVYKQLNSSNDQSPFHGKVDDAKLLYDTAKYQPGVYFVVTSNTYDIYTVQDKINNGWISSAKSRVVSNTGYFTLIPLKDPENVIQLLTKTEPFLKKESEKCDQVSSHLNAATVASKDHMDTLTSLLNLEREKQTLISEHQNIVALNKQIIELRQKLEEKDAEIKKYEGKSSRRFNLKRSHSIPHDKHATHDNFDVCIDAIVNFDRTKLLTRDARDELLERKNNRIYIQ